MTYLVEGKYNNNVIIEDLYSFFLCSFINAYVGELVSEEMAATRDFKYLAILDHKSHLYTHQTKKRPESDVQMLNGKIILQYRIMFC